MAGQRAHQLPSQGSTHVHLVEGVHLRACQPGKASTQGAVLKSCLSIHLRLVVSSGSQSPQTRTTNTGCPVAAAQAGVAP